MPVRKARSAPASETPFDPAYLQAAARAAAVAEAARRAPLPPGVGEKLVKCLWFDQFLDPASLRLEDGRALRVLTPGFWNEGPGPDFLDAQIAIDDGPVLRGSVEAHILASDWARHNHAGDPAYDNTILHVVFSNDLADVDLVTAGRHVPQLALDRGLSGDLAEVIAALDLDLPRAGGGPSACRDALRRLNRPPEWTGRFLDLAGDARALARAETWTQALQSATPSQCLCEGVFDALGYKGNRRPFRQLAQAATLDSLRRFVAADAPLERRRLVIEAILFGAAGLLPSEAEAAPWDAESREYAASLRREWQTAAPAFAARRVERSAWTFAGARPANYPTRRIAAAADLLAMHLHSGLYRAVTESLIRSGGDAPPERRARHAASALIALFTTAGGRYWPLRYTFGGKPLASPLALIGRERALAILINVVTPLVLACARREGDGALERRLHTAYAAIGRTPGDAVVRDMESRIFDSPAAARAAIRSARRQQGLIQLHHDFCHRAPSCGRCAFLALAAGENAPC